MDLQVAKVQLMDMDCHVLGVCVEENEHCFCYRESIEIANQHVIK